MQVNSTVRYERVLGYLLCKKSFTFLHLQYLCIIYQHAAVGCGGKGGNEVGGLQERRGIYATHSSPILPNLRSAPTCSFLPHYLRSLLLALETIILRKKLS